MRLDAQKPPHPTASPSTRSEGQLRRVLNCEDQKWAVGRADVISQRKVGDVVSRSRSQSAPSMRSARRRDAVALTRRIAPASPARRHGYGTRPMAVLSAPLNFFSLPEPCAEGSAELSMRRPRPTPMSTRTPSRRRRRSSVRTRRRAGPARSVNPYPIGARDLLRRFDISV